ncbi:DUF6962 family protein [Dyadobacter fermentans]|uniref:Uncharacterized protein n=1 Tax=Dyadobacter fermentans (strain ATCC 700827 / DSM 18053 / CIP 107007 / KCTC 52180 / NS114) TaxID=471854 RepID=C6W4M4_DYAFD|nr:hypothetical protein [Dyadobacter fermentans]ACT94125.1 hypothetical protein Dfer_2910 [Dyadobacter fermentans DSM 18053]
MNIFLNPHIFSNLVLTITSLFVFLRYFRQQPVLIRWLWGIFFGSIALAAFTDFLFYAGVEGLGLVKEVVMAGEMTLGAMCLVTASWCLIMRYDSGRFLFFSTVGLGALLLYCITWFRVEYVGLIIKAFCILVTLLISCVGLANRQKSALWTLFSMMLLALSTKSGKLPLPMDPVDINHYMMVLSVICVGRAVRDQYKILF